MATFRGVCWEMPGNNQEVEHGNHRVDILAPANTHVRVGSADRIKSNFTREVVSHLYSFRVCAIFGVSLCSCILIAMTLSTVDFVRLLYLLKW